MASITPDTTILFDPYNISRRIFERVRILARPTLGDQDYFERWKNLGVISNEDPTVLVVDQRVDVTDELVETMPNLKAIVSATTGHTHLKLTKKIPLITLRGEREFLKDIKSVSEFTVKLVFDLLRMNVPGDTLYNKTVGIIGSDGRIGSHVIKALSPMCKSIILCDKNNQDALEFLVVNSDIITIHVDENIETIGLISKHLISKMKNKFFINTARPLIVDNEALMAGLSMGNIKAAACDFKSYFEIQPWFKRTPNLLLTDHIAGSTLTDRIKTDEFIFQKTKSFIVRGYCQQHGTTPTLPVSELQKI